MIGVIMNTRPLSFNMIYRYRERLHDLLEEERSQYRKSWQLGLSSLEQQQQHLMDAQKTAMQVLVEADTCIFIQRYKKNGFLAIAIHIISKIRILVQANSIFQLTCELDYEVRHLKKLNR